VIDPFEGEQLCHGSLGYGQRYVKRGHGPIFDAVFPCSDLAIDKSHLSDPQTIFSIRRVLYRLARVFRLFFFVREKAFYSIGRAKQYHTLEKKNEDI
jgi:hypothetical protein